MYFYFYISFTNIKPNQIPLTHPLTRDTPKMSSLYITLDFNAQHTPNRARYRDHSSIHIDLALYCNDFDEFPLIEAPVQLQLEDEEDDSRDLALYFNDPDDYPELVVAPVDEFDEDGDVIM